MNIGISTSVVQRGKTGVGQYILALVRALIAAKSPHRFILFVLEDDLPLFAFAREDMTLVSVPERHRSPLLNIIWHQITLPKLVRQHKIDVLHIPSYRRMLWRHPCPLVATIHDLAPLCVKGKYDLLRTFYARWVVKHLAKRQDQIIAVSNNTAQDIKHFFLTPSSKLNVVHNGVDHSHYYSENVDCSKALITQRYGLTSPFFLYVSRLEHPGKNHIRLIKAFEMLHKSHPDWRLVFAGSDWDGAEIIHEAVSKSNCKNSIRSLGFVPSEVLPDLMRAAEVFVYPSLYEGFGLPIAEAMACGCPVICSNCNSMLEVAGDAAATANPENVLAWKTQLKRLASNPHLRRKHALAGLQRARSFDWKHTASASIKVFEAAGGLGQT